MDDKIVLNQDSPSVKHLCAKDKRLAKAICMVGEITYVPHKDGYAFLIHEVIEQMLSIKTTQKIYSRLEALCGGSVTPTAISHLSDEQIRSTGTSLAKVSYIKSITDAVLYKKIILADLEEMTDGDIQKELMKLRGIGHWTAKMYLIFVLDRLNVLPYEDTAFLQAYCWLYNSEDKSPELIKKRCKKWIPYSSIAARYLYKALDMGITKEEFHLYK
jgi:DNA-3-methyladenine glycosylase II